jgi:hypothetical protein
MTTTLLRRTGLSVVTMLIALFAAYASTWWFAQGGAPAPPVSLDGIGTVETIQLPIGSRSREEINSFLVKLDMVDDFARVFINNYLVLTTAENDIIFGRENLQKQISDLRVRRRNPSQVETDIRRFLRPGKNFLVAELENSILGGCEMQVGLTVNGKIIKSFPQWIPRNFALDISAVNSDLAHRFRHHAEPNNNDFPELKISDTGDALCSRRVFEFILQE